MRSSCYGCLLSLLALSAGPLAAQDVEKLLGSWTCDTPEGRARLVFHSDNGGFGPVTSMAPAQV